jgi:hypothetical protein
MTPNFRIRHVWVSLGDAKPGEVKIGTPVMMDTVRGRVALQCDEFIKVELVQDVRYFHALSIFNADNIESPYTA